MTTPQIPARFLAKCELDPDHHDLDIRQPGVHQWTAGWVKLRGGGGGHGISLAKRENRWACEQCVKRTVEGWLERMPL